MSYATPSRRGLLTASAWAVPSIVVAAAAPSFAASSDLPSSKVCIDTNYALNWAGAAWSYSSTSGSGVAGTSNGVGVAKAVQTRTLPGHTYDPVAITVANTFSGNAVGLVNNNGKNMVVPNHLVGGLGQRGLEMYQGISGSQAKSSSERRQDSQTVAVTFDRPVRNLAFTITDIDFTTGQYADRVELLGPFTAVKPSTVTGSGTQASPWQGNASSGNVDHVTSGQGNVKVTFAGPVTAFALRFWNADGGSSGKRYLNAQGAQAIFLSNFTFNANSCLPG